jgi:hypothetical protein
MKALEHGREVLAGLGRLALDLGEVRVEFLRLDLDLELRQVLIDDDVIDEVVEDVLSGLLAELRVDALQAAEDGQLGDRLAVDGGGSP